MATHPRQEVDREGEESSDLVEEAEEVEEGEPSQEVET